MSQLIVRAPLETRTSTETDRRAFPRRRGRGSATCKPLSRRFSKGVRAKLLDICQGGVGLLVTEPLQPEQGVEIELESLSGSLRLVREAEVRWVSGVVKGVYRVGCLWRQRLSFAELQPFV